MKRLTYAGKTSTKWMNKYLYEVLSTAHRATEEAKSDLSPAPTDDDLVALAFRVTRATEVAILTGYEESPYHTPGSDTGLHRFLNRLGLIRGIFQRACLVLRMTKVLNGVDESAILTNQWLKDVYQEAQDHLRAHVYEQQRRVEKVEV